MRLLIFGLFGFLPALAGAQMARHIATANALAGSVETEILAASYLDVHQSDQRAVWLGDKPLKCGTVLNARVLNHWKHFNYDQQNLLKPTLARPELPHQAVSPSGKFLVHYTNSGNNRVSQTDNDANGVPDFVDSVAYYFDVAYHAIVEELGYPPPPPDKGIDGLEYDIYVINNPSLYGETYPENLISRGPDQYTSYIKVDNDYKDFPTSGIDGLRVTSAHEFFHAVHMGIKFNYNDDSFMKKEVFYYEVSSVWMEDVVHDDVNDYYFYLDDFFNHIDKSFTTYDYRYEYGNCLWNHMLAKKFGDQIITGIWAEIVDRPVLDAIDVVLQRNGSSFKDQFEDYAVWNYFTGSRSDSVTYYPEGTFYPEVEYIHSQVFDADTTIMTSCNELSFSYFHFDDVLTGNNIVISPVNMVLQKQDDLSVKFEISRQKAHLFREIAPKFAIRMIVDNFGFWRANAIVLDVNHIAAVSHFSAVEENMINRTDAILGYGPNPFILSKHSSFNVYFQLREEGDVEISIMDENGRLAEQKQIFNLQTGVNAFTWNPYAPGFQNLGSGIYVLLFKARGVNEKIKFAVIQ